MLSSSICIGNSAESLAKSSLAMSQKWQSGCVNIVIVVFDSAVPSITSYGFVVASLADGLVDGSIPMEADRRRSGVSFSPAGQAAAAGLT